MSFSEGEPARGRGLIYHDVVPAGQQDLSGMVVPGAHRYKLTPELFNAHLEALALACPAGPALCTTPSTTTTAPPPLWLTFDDGGRSAYTTIAPSLEARGWRGHFLVVSDFLGRPGFMTPDMCRELHQRGHVIGSHSVDHPFRFGELPRQQLAWQWSHSLASLQDLLGAPVLCASLPGGQYSLAAAQEAAAAGVKYLFTSEPVTRIERLGDCLILGRFSVLAGDPPGLAAALARGDQLPRFRQWLGWNSRKLLKRYAGGLYQALRDRLLG